MFVYCMEFVKIVKNQPNIQSPLPEQVLHLATILPKSPRRLCWRWCPLVWRSSSTVTTPHPLLPPLCSTSLSPLCISFYNQLHTQLLVSSPCISSLYLCSCCAGGVHAAAQGGMGGGGHGLEPLVAPRVGHLVCWYFFKILIDKLLYSWYLWSDYIMRRKACHQLLENHICQPVKQFIESHLNTLFVKEPPWYNSIKAAF